MRVLSIDLDYCMSSCIDLYDGIYDDENPFTRWEIFEENNGIQSNNLFIDEDKIEYCFNTFIKSLFYCNDVEFAYDHDAILYRLENERDIEIINIDYHNDFLNFGGLSEYSDGSYEQDLSVLKMEYSFIEKYNRVMEGNWVAWLNIKNKLRKYIWIRDKSSLGDTNNPTFTDYYSDFLKEKFNHFTKEEYQIENYKFDYIFICLSPVYVPKKYWKVFSIFMSAFEEITGNPIKIIDRKYEIESRYRYLNEKILPKK